MADTLNSRIEAARLASEDIRPVESGALTDEQWQRVERRINLGIYRNWFPSDDKYQNLARPIRLYFRKRREQIAEMKKRNSIWRDVFLCLRLIAGMAVIFGLLYGWTQVNQAILDDPLKVEQTRR